jgi:hypothetical protein
VSDVSYKLSYEIKVSDLSGGVAISMGSKSVGYRLLVGENSTLDKMPEMFDG